MKYSKTVAIDKYEMQNCEKSILKTFYGLSGEPKLQSEGQT